jgi:hypothetical protein
MVEIPHFHIFMNIRQKILKGWKPIIGGDVGKK